MESIVLRGAREHNLANIDLTIPRNALTVVTGLSGSGKSSLAFDTLYAEGQRRYIESLSTYARQFLEQMEKPDVDAVEGLSPAISIDQRTTTRNARSTVGTITEIYDYLRLLFSSVGKPHCPNCERPISRQLISDIVARMMELPENSRVTVLAPVVRERKGEFRKLFERYHREGYVRAKVDGSPIFLEDPPKLVKSKNHTVEIVVDRLIIGADVVRRLEDSVSQASKMADGLVVASVQGGPEMLFSERLACIDCGIDVPTLEPRSFSFNSRFGACPDCKGLGSKLQLNLSRLVVNSEASADQVELSLQSKELGYLFPIALSAILNHQDCDPGLQFNELPEEVLSALRDGVKEKIEFQYGGISYRSQFLGLNHWFLERMESTRSQKRKQQLQAYMSEADCPACKGSRLRAESRAVRIQGRSISDYCCDPLDDCAEALKRVRLSPREHEIAGPVLEEILQRIAFLVDVGLNYLTLDRQAASLSAGEAQRVRLATQVGSELRGVLYVLDEPSIGLHTRDTGKLLVALKKLRDLGNTIVVVEHDEDTIRASDHIVDLGPGAGILGGKVVAEGSLEEVIRCTDSLTGNYLSGERSILPPDEPRIGTGRSIDLAGVTHNNLKNINVSFPLGMLITVTGVSGAGKSSLVDEVLYRALSRHLYNSLLEPGAYEAIEGLEFVDKVIEIDQSPIGRTPRSNPATYSGAFTPLRELFAVLPESKMRGYKPGRFSFNVKGGRCEVCRGAGLRKVEMNFLPDVYVQCEACNGARYNRETLAVKYKGHSIADFLDMSVEKARPLLEGIPPLKNKLHTLLSVGLGYITLGQSSTTLSGGEAQRVKLAKELSRRSTGKTLYILDEPTTGLHFEDVKNLLAILHELVNLGNTVIVIEHNLDIVKSSDWIVDLGPEGGADGGELIAVGRPSEVSRVNHSYTGQALKKVL